MSLITQAEYARRRGVSRAAICKRTRTVGGPVPVHGPKKLIDPEEADALWDATMSPQGAANAESGRRSRDVTATQLAQARAAALVVDVQSKRLSLEQRRGALISRDRATLKVFAFARTYRTAMQAWPQRVGPQLAASFACDAGAVTAFLQASVRELLDVLSRERVEL